MRRAALEAFAAIGLLSVMDAIIKDVAARYPTFEVVFARYLFGAAIILAIAAVLRPGWPTRQALAVNGVRALLVVVTANCFFYALGTLPLAETLALSFISPVLVAFFAATLLRERIDLRVVGGIASGFVGMAVIVWGKLEGGTFQGSRLGVAAVLVSCVTYALSMVLLRARAQQDHVITIVAIQSLVPGLIIAGPAAFVWVAPPLPDWGAFAAIGALGVAGHLLLTRAYSRAEASRLATMEYTALIWAVLLGFAFFGEVPTAATLAGGGFIILGALVASAR